MKRTIARAAHFLDGANVLAYGGRAITDLHQLNSCSDEQLLQLSQQSPDAFEMLLSRYQSAFLRKAESVLHSRDDAEDAVQDAFVRIYRFQQKFAQAEGASFKAWGYKILMNVIFTRYAVKKRERSRTVDLEAEDYERLPDTLDVFKNLEMREYVSSVLEKVSEDVRRLLTLYYLEGKTQEEIAQVEGATTGAIKIRMFRARQAFKVAHDIFN